MYRKGQKASLNKYLGPDDSRYMELRNQVRIFLQEFLFFKAVRNASLEALTEMLDKDRIDPDTPNSRGDTALHIAARDCLHDVAAALISWSANMSLTTADGKTALQIAVEKVDRDMVSLLLKKGARPDANYNGTALWDLPELLPINDAADATREEICELLRNPPLVDGPLSTPPEERHERPQHHGNQDWVQPAPQPDGETACKGFHITIANFFYTRNGQEKFALRTPTVYDLLYVKTPSEICESVMAQARTAADAPERYFTWYHIPANNVSGV